ncbi:MAG: DUF1080 domain-containing protein, partial [Verrucomicrobiota bacterium]
MSHLLSCFSAVIVLWFDLALAGVAAEGETAANWKSLFNGKDLSNWDKYIAPPKDGEPPLGLNNDPKGVFTVVQVDGAPAIRVSGEMFGGITARDEFDNFHIRVEYKWGTKRWPPRANVGRDSGLLYHSIGPPGA